MGQSARQLKIRSKVFGAFLVPVAIYLLIFKKVNIRYYRNIRLLLYIYVLHSDINVFQDYMNETRIILF